MADRDQVNGDAGKPHGVADDLIARQHVELSEQVGPIMLAAADERQFLRARVFHVH